VFALFGLPLSIPAMICGFLGIQKANQGLANNKGLAIAGLAIAAVGSLLSIGIAALGIGANLINWSDYQ